MPEAGDSGKIPLQATRPKTRPGLNARKIFVADPLRPLAPIYLADEVQMLVDRHVHGDSKGQ
jgi:hypothetical protein